MDNIKLRVQRNIMKKSMHASWSRIERNIGYEQEEATDGADSNNINVLPMELLVMILSLLDLKSAIRVEPVSKSWQSAVCCCLSKVKSISLGQGLSGHKANGLCHVFHAGLLKIPSLCQNVTNMTIENLRFPDGMSRKVVGRSLGKFVASFRRLDVLKFVEDYDCCIGPEFLCYNCNTVKCVDITCGARIQQMFVQLCKRWRNLELLLITCEKLSHRKLVRGIRALPMINWYCCGEILPGNCRCYVLH